MKRGAGGGLETDSTGALWAVDQLSDEVLLVDVEDDLITDLPWLSLSSNGGTLAPGESTTVKVSISSKDVDPGTLAANVIVRSDSGRQSEDLRPGDAHDHHVPGRRQCRRAVVHRCRRLHLVRPTRRPAKAAWGYQGKDKVTSTRAPIAGTEDDALFQSQRTTPDSDLVLHVPRRARRAPTTSTSGSRRPSKVAPGKRVFDVLVDDELTQYAYDAASAVGRGRRRLAHRRRAARGRPADRRAAGREGPAGPEHRRAARHARPARRREAEPEPAARAAGTGPRARGAGGSLVLDEGDRRALPAGHHGLRVARRRPLRRPVVRLQLPVPVLRHGLGRRVRDDERRAGLRPGEHAGEQHGAAVAGARSTPSTRSGTT